MSQRVKKPGRVEDNQGKRRRRRPSGSDGEEDGTRSGSNSGGNSSFPSIGGMWTPKHLSDLKVSSIYNRNSAEKPAELYRKDLISAMKLADSEPLTPEEYWLITDPWKQEWEKGVQVPVNPESLPEPEVVVISPANERSHDFRLPKKKYIRVTHDDFFNPDYHQLVSTAARAEKVCSYDLDDVDGAWLGCANADRGMQTLPVISEFLMEQVIEELELQCWEQVQTILKSQEGLGIEYDENVICDVCRSPESEEGNEMVFCDACNICVHQACYGITSIPSGSWLCRTCTLGIRPSCVLCPNMGGAMKATRSGQKWAHVACAIWIPEVSIGSVEKMEPITKISAIPQSRWSLICVICKEKVGACIQCSVKTCKTAYHVTCAFKSGLEMKPIIVDENAEDGIKLRSYCQKHSVNTKKEKPCNSGSEEDGEKKKARAMTAEERNQARAEKLQQIESEFYKYVRLKDVSQNLAVDMDIVMLIYNYWKLKRKSLNNRPLVPPRPETTQLLTQQQEQDLEQMKMFVQLRQDLERVRNLCYMVSRREKLSRTYFRLREQTFQKQVAILSDKSVDLGSLSSSERCAILDANHGPSIYDQVYSKNGAECLLKDYDTIVSLISGEDKKDKVINGVIKCKKSSTAVGTFTNSETNAYKRQYVNGARRKNLMGDSCSSLSESESVSDNVVANTRKLKLSPSTTGRKPLSYLFDTDSSVDGTSSSIAPGSKGSAAKSNKVMKGRPRVLRKPQKSTKKSSTSDSDELELPVPKAPGGKIGKTEAPIYSDSDSEESSRKQASSPLATKASVKEFTRKSNKKVAAEPPRGAAPTGAKIVKGLKGKAKGGGRKKKGFEQTELIVPQRQAAKKATESIRSVKSKKEAANPDGSPMVHSPAVNTTSPRSRDSDFNDNDTGKLKDSMHLSENDTTKRSKSREKVGSSNKKCLLRKSKRREESPIEDSTLRITTSESRDQYDFEGSNDGSKNVTYVPQRQAAKKAAEHIRSGLSNIVAARLIIEDEMEAVRKKTKGDKSIVLKKALESLIPNNLVKKTNKLKGKASPVENLPEEDQKNLSTNLTDAKSRPKKRIMSRDEGRPGVKGGKKEVSNRILNENMIKAQDTDWPFLDRGSQSECRRSRERSSSSCSSSSSGSSSSDSSSCSRSSASSRSSSPASASPESNKNLGKVQSSVSSNSSPIKSSTLSSTPRGPSRKLKTSDRSPESGPRSEIIEGKKPPPKSRGPGKLRRGRNSASGPLSLSAEFSPSKQLTGRHSTKTNERRTTEYNSSSSSSSRSSTPSPSPSTRKTEKTSKSTKAESKGRKGKSPGFREKEKTVDSAKAESKTSNSAKTNLKSKASVATKALVTSSKTVSGDLDLSSDSESDAKLSENTFASKLNNQTTSSPSLAAATETKSTKNASKAKAKSSLNLSDSENEGAEEKENSCVVPEPCNSAAGSSTPSKNKVQKPNTSSAAVSILSPLTPSAENKEKELLSRYSDNEPDVKRARLDSGSISTSIHPSSSNITFHSVSGNLSSSITSLNSKSLFSPSRLGQENELLDFDSELYDLAKSVSADYSQCDEEGGVGGSGSLPFSFSQNFLCREDNGEDSAQATLNLVEKLRLQHARKSGCPRSSMDGSDLSMIEDGSKSPISTPRLSSENKSDTPSQASLVDVPLQVSLEKLDEASSINTSKDSPGRDKLVEGDERWVPPSSSPVEKIQDSDISVSIIASENKSKAPAATQGLQEEISVFSSSITRSSGSRKEMLDQVQVHRTTVTNKPIEVWQQSSSERHLKITESFENIPPMDSESMENSRVFDDKRSSSTVSSMKSSSSGPQSVIPTQSEAPTSSGTAGINSQKPFLYSHADISVANVVSSMTAAMESNSPQSPFFRSHTQSNPPQTPLDSSLSPGYSRQAFSQSVQYSHSQQSEHLAQQRSKLDETGSSSSSTLPQRRTSGYLEEKSIPDSLVSVVTSGMLPLAKPSIASPSMILAANNVKNITPPPPPQSTVAQIIENVVNNHANNSSIVGAQEILSAMLNINTQSSLCLSTSTGKKNAPCASPLPDLMKSSILTVPNSLPTNGVINGSALSSGSAVVFNASSKGRDFDLSTKEAVTGVLDTNTASPRGRGKRATTPRVAIKTEKILTTCETNGVKGKGRGDRKLSTSPGRAKAPTPRRGGGRGRGKGKGFVFTRKDLAGTVYDIDFDEFEENVQEKLDLRMLRERRKSNDLHLECKISKSEAVSPVDHLMGSVDIMSPRLRDLDAIRNVSESFKSQNQIALTTSPSCNTTLAPILQPPLPGPVNMRTYNLASSISAEIQDETKRSKSGTLPREDSTTPRLNDISAIFSRSYGKESINEFEELNETLKALTSGASKTPVSLSISKSSNVISIVNQSFSCMNSRDDLNMASAHPFSFVGREPTVESVIDPIISSASGDFSRNQLKVKIKGPFLDANYGCHSIAGDASSSSQHYQNSLHPSGPTQVVNIPTNNNTNLRRMRKKELLRQYWTQDMNMDGNSCGPSHEADFSVIPVNSVNHPINRSVITIPKAVASMAIIPTKEDYRLETIPSRSDNPMGSLIGTAKDIMGSGSEKRKRSRGIREMAALGIVSSDSPRERRRERMESSLSSGNYSQEMGKKRGRGNKKPVRSTFIPPTLADSENSSFSDKKTIFLKGNAVSTSISTVVTAVNHPTPKLKIKFADLSKNSVDGVLANAAGHNNVHSDSSDKEAPSKKAKGRPPKKRGISEMSASAPPSMEDLKRENMKFRERVMQDFAVEERKEILQLHGTRRHKKHKRKTGAVSSETDDGTRPKSPEVKVIADGPKLILRIGKRPVAGPDIGVGDGELKSKGNTGEGCGSSDVSEGIAVTGEHDSGFTGSSEGSSESVSESTGASKDIHCSATPIKTEINSLDPSGGFPSLRLNSTIPIAGSSLSSYTEELSAQGPEIPRPQFVKEENDSSEKSIDKIMPIRLKLSRCFEGYALKKRKDQFVSESGPSTTPSAKQSDSCEVR